MVLDVYQLLKGLTGNEPNIFYVMSFDLRWPLGVVSRSTNEIHVCTWSCLLHKICSLKETIIHCRTHLRAFSNSNFLIVRRFSWYWFATSWKQFLSLCKTIYATNWQATLSRFFRLFYFVILWNHERIMNLIESAVFSAIKISHLCNAWRLVHLDSIFSLQPVGSMENGR